MSTISKLNPKVREDRRMRAAMVRDAKRALHQVAEEFGIGSSHEFEALQVTNFLEKIKLSPQRPGERKNDLFIRIARELSNVQPHRP